MRAGYSLAVTVRTRYTRRPAGSWLYKVKTLCQRPESVRMHPNIGTNFRIPLEAPKPWSVPIPVSARISAVS